MKKAWVITVDMGYGHQRAAYPLKDIAYERIITANSDKIITPKGLTFFLNINRIIIGINNKTLYSILF